LSYKTIIKEASPEIVINKSRFIAYTKPVFSEAEATEFISSIKRKHKTANHNVPIYIIGENQKYQKYSDDGEPSGTAGLPVLEMLKKENITNIAIVITRYFGGIKLGTGGLVRAYTASAKAGLQDSEIVEVNDYIKLGIKLSYTLHGKLTNYIQNNDVTTLSTEFTDEVELVMCYPINLDEQILADITELGSGTIEMKVKEEVKGYIYRSELILV